MIWDYCLIVFSCVMFYVSLLLLQMYNSGATSFRHLPMLHLPIVCLYLYIICFYDGNKLIMIIIMIYVTDLWSVLKNYKKTKQNKKKTKQNENKTKQNKKNQTKQKNKKTKNKHTAAIFWYMHGKTIIMCSDLILQKMQVKLDFFLHFW